MTSFSVEASLVYFAYEKRIASEERGKRGRESGTIIK